MKFIRAGLMLLFAFSVLAFGSVEVWSESLLEIGAGILFVGWAAIVVLNPGVQIEWNPLNWPLAGFLAIGLVQLALHITPYPFLTRVELLKLAAYLIIFFLSTQAFRQRRDLTNLAWFLIFLCFSVSLLGIVQHFTSGSKLYGFRALTAGGDPFGPFVNRNDFAGFVELTLPAGLALDDFPRVAARHVSAGGTSDNCSDRRHGAFRLARRNRKLRIRSSRFGFVGAFA